MHTPATYFHNQWTGLYMVSNANLRTVVVKRQIPVPVRNDQLSNPYDSKQIWLSHRHQHIVGWKDITDTTTGVLHDTYCCGKWSKYLISKLSYDTKCFCAVLAFTRFTCCQSTISTEAEMTLNLLNNLSVFLTTSGT